MAVPTHVITLDEVLLLEVDSDPSQGAGLTAPTGSLALLDGGGGLWKKATAPDTGWIKMAEEYLLQYNALSPYPTYTTVSASTLTLTATSNSTQFFTGSTLGQVLRLPNATTLQKSHTYEVWNMSSTVVVLQNSSGGAITNLDAGAYARIILRDNVVATGPWDVFQVVTSSIAAGVVNYKLVSSVDFLTTSTTDVIITGFTLTPMAGEYACFFNGSSYLTTTPKAHWWSFYKAGAKITDSERTQDTAHSNQTMVDSTITVASFNGSQTVDVRVRTSNGSLTMKSRTILLTRLGPPV